MYKQHLIKVQFGNHIIELLKLKKATSQLSKTVKTIISDTAPSYILGRVNVHVVEMQILRFSIILTVRILIVIILLF